ncbi:MAG: NTP transferase domain-containing protein [Candidatus Firestonebacteria bacterium]|nr:NTP transferase domain-containing protein [Candidatus Firestonebacteria bacterium]
MKGVILAGGLGTRLKPLTDITNKHLLPVYDRPMIFHPLEKMAEAGIKEVMLVTGGNNAGDFLRLLGDGRQFGIRRLQYTYQKGEGGIAQALGLAEEFAEGQKILVFLGDNIILDPIKPFADSFRQQAKGGMVLLKALDDPRSYGVPVFKGSRIFRIDEKPAKPASTYAVIGAYFYDPNVFKIIKTLKPSKRGELEITDVNNAYIRKGQMQYGVLNKHWADAGESLESWFAANLLMRDLSKK